MASFSCVGYDDNKTLSYKAISGGSVRIGDFNGNKVQVGDLVRIRQSYSQKMIGKMAIVTKIWQGINVTIHIVDSGEEHEYHIKKLEVV